MSTRRPHIPWVADRAPSKLLRVLCRLAVPGVAGTAGAKDQAPLDPGWHRRAPHSAQDPGDATAQQIWLIFVLRKLLILAEKLANKKLCMRIWRDEERFLNVCKSFATTLLRTEVYDLHIGIHVVCGWGRNMCMCPFYALCLELLWLRTKEKGGDQREHARYNYIKNSNLESRGNISLWTGIIDYWLQRSIELYCSIRLIFRV